MGTDVSHGGCDGDTVLVDRGVKPGEMGYDLWTHVLYCKFLFDFIVFAIIFQQK